MNFLILMSLYKYMEAQCVMSLCALQADLCNKGDKVSLLMLHGLACAAAREELWKSADRQGDADYIINLDSDHIYKASTVYSLVKRMEENKLQILSAKYFVRDPKIRALAMLRGDTFETTRRIVPEPNETGLQKVDVMGFGFCIIKPALIHMLIEKYKILFTDEETYLTPSIVDDVCFAKKCKAEGIPLYYDADVTVGHLGTIIY